MNNAAKHSKASRINVTTPTADGLSDLTVKDDGVGFDTGTVDREHHFGLQLIAETDRGCSAGTVEVRTSLGSGTVVPPL